MTRLKTLVFAITIISLGTLNSCGGDEDNVGTISLRGTVNGADWVMKFGKAEVDDFDSTISSQFISSASAESDPCDIVIPGSDYLSARLPQEPGTYSLPFPTSSNSITFRFSDGGFLVSTGGSVEVISVTSTAITGFIDAQGDSENFVRGNFVLDVCGED